MHANMNSASSHGITTKGFQFRDGAKINFADYLAKKLYDTTKRDAAGNIVNFGFGLQKKEQIFAKEFLDWNPSSGAPIKLSSTGSIFTGDFTASIEKVIRSITPNVTPDWSFESVCPVKTVLTQKIYIEQVAHIWGQTADYTYGTEPHKVPKLDNWAFSFTPGVRREFIEFNEEQLTFWRELGTIDVPGAMTKLAYNVELLYGRMFNRFKTDIMSAFYNGGLSYNGKLVTYGLNPNKRVTPATGTAWLIGTPGNYAVNPNADPLTDLLYWLGGGVPTFNKYLGLIQGIYMSPITAFSILANPNVHDYIQYAFGNERFLSPDNPMNVQKIVDFFVPGFNIPVVIERQGWITSQTDEDAFEFFVPDGYIFFLVNANQFGGPLAEYQITSAIQNGSWAKPEPGLFMRVEDCTTDGSRGGPRNPHVNLVGGFTAAPNIQRPNDILSAYVISAT